MRRTTQRLSEFLRLDGVHVKNALVIVESPAKAKKLAEFLGAGYTVEASVGHIRDLPGGASELPAAYKKGPYARFDGVNVDDGFKPLYVVHAGKRAHIRYLKQVLQKSDELYLATDEDREGEAIAWHLIEELSPRIPVKRMVFHEITPTAIRAAVNSTRELDHKLVDAQETRRILDRLFGWEVSPVLWEKVKPRLSAGRVQSVATRIVVERERERMGFVAASYWTISGLFAADQGDTREFKAELATIDGAKLALGRDFSNDGQLKRQNVTVLTETAAHQLANELQGARYQVLSRESKPYRRRPAAPFITSTYQQEAGRKLKMSAKMAMSAAQGLYEKGYITYMRTDSTTLSDSALQAARATIKSRYGAQYLPQNPRLYTKKSKNAQEAHEAIRPAGDTFRSPQEVATEVSRAEARAYELIWKRTIASQMTDCTGETVQLRIGTTINASEEIVFRASGTVISHRGFREVYEETTDATAATDPNADEERRLPAIHEGDQVHPTKPLQPEDHETSPPPRYTEASLVKRLEELGVGRPSTYASIIDTIMRRGYVWKNVSALVPSFTAFSVVNLMERHFPNLVDYSFTAQMEEDLDRIANGTEERLPWLTRFYFGGGEGSEPGLKEKVETRHADIDARSINTIPLGMSEDGQPVVLRVGRYGPFVQRGDTDHDTNDGNNSTNRASVPEDLPPDELTLDKALEYLAKPKGGRVLGSDPASGKEIYVKEGRFGPYVQLGSSETKDQKPKMESLFATMSVETITLDDAQRLLSLPRTVGTDPTDGETITAQNGRYGPYVKKGSESRSLDTEEQLFSVTVEECLALFAQPKRRRAQTAKPPLRELGEDPNTGKAMLIKDGRYGPYVTDGEHNASLRTGDSVEKLTVERASELLAERRISGATKKASKKSATKSARTAAKKSAKNAATKTVRTAAKKTATKSARSSAKKTAKKTATKRPT